MEGFKCISFVSSDARALLKRCFKNSTFSFVPFEIWLEIVFNADASSIHSISQTCWGFKKLADNIRKRFLDLALLFRKEGKIPSAFSSLRTSASLGDLEAIFHLGNAYYEGGWGKTENVSKAAKFFERAAKRGNVPGMAYHALCLKNGYGEEKDEDCGQSWGQKVLSLPCDPYAWGCCYKNGLGTEADKEKAFKMFEAAAEEGSGYGQVSVGVSLFVGAGCERNYEKAFAWFMKAAEQGLSAGQCLVAILSRDGLGTTKDVEVSKIWFRKAADQGDQYAIQQFN